MKIQKTFSRGLKVTLDDGTEVEFTLIGRESRKTVLGAKAWEAELRFQESLVNRVVTEIGVKIYADSEVE